MGLFKRRERTSEFEVIEVEEIQELIERLESACDRADAAFDKLSHVKKELDKSVSKALVTNRSIRPRGRK